MATKDKITIYNRSPVESLWKHLHDAWSLIDQPKGENRIWRKSCKLFDAFIEEVEPSRFVFSIDANGERVFEQLMGVANWDNASYEGQQLLFEFVAIGVEILGGFSITLNRPANEIRFKQITQMDGYVYGLGEDGVLYMRTYPRGGGKPAWTPCRMERSGADPIEVHTIGVRD